MFPTFKVSIAFKQLKKDILGNIVGIGAIAQVRQGDSKHDIPVIFDRLSKCLFFHNHLPVTVMILDEVLTIDTLWPDEMFQIQAGKTYQNKPVPYWQKESPPVRGPGIRRARRGNVTCQKGTGLFWSVLSGETSHSSADPLSPVT